MSDGSEQQSGEVVLLEAEFLPSAPMYNTVQASIAYGVIALLMVFFSLFTFGLSLLALPIPVGLFFLTKWYYTKYYERLSCTLTDRKLVIARGVWNRVEQAVPMDKITDLQMTQSFIMRWLDLEAIRVETAGQTMVAGGLAGIVGIKDSREFRAAVLAQRDLVVGTAAGGPAEPMTAAADTSDQSVLEEIRDALLRIEDRLEERSH